MLKPTSESLEITLRKILQNRILLPDFQRQFVWKDEESQRKLVASVITKMPIGSILLLKSTHADEYACKPLGAHDILPQEKLPTGDVEFLLDGQQRMTVLANVFSDVIFQISPLSSQLVAPAALKRRFFLTLPKWGNADQDLFGLHTLSFPLELPDSDEPAFLTGDILPNIKVIPFTVGGRDKDRGYNPYSNSGPSQMQELIAFCKSDPDWYYIPLFMLIDLKPGGLSTAYLTKIVKSIAEDISGIMSGTLLAGLASDATFDYISYIEHCIGKEYLECYYGASWSTQPDDAIRDMFENELMTKVDRWQQAMLSYLKACLTQINLSQISLADSQRARAIDIYENLNRGGVSLDIFDLLMARVAKVTTMPFDQRLARCVEAGHDYPTNRIVSPAARKSFMQLINTGTYHASMHLECYNDERNEFPKVYLDAFLNVLTLLCAGKSLNPGQFTDALLKRQRKLMLSAEEIDDNCERSCEAIDRALFFFQSRCGIRSVREINYTLMISLVAYILNNDDCYKGDHSERIFEILEAWYWASVLSGAYDKDQNQVIMADLNRLLKIVQEVRTGDSPDVDFIVKRKEDVLAAKGFSDCDFLLLTNPDTDDYPKGVIGSSICQFYLARTYADLALSETTSTETITLNAFHADAKLLEVHHVIPLGSGSVSQSAKRIRGNKKHFLNSPLNLMYISAQANQAISNRSLAEYSSQLPTNAALSNVGFHDVHITVASTDDDRKKVLRQRHAILRAQITQRIMELLQM